MADEMSILPCYHCYVCIVSIILRDLFLFKPLGYVVEVNLVKNMVNVDKIRYIIHEHS